MSEDGSIDESLLRRVRERLADLAGARQRSALLGTGIRMDPLTLAEHQAYVQQLYQASMAAQTVDANLLVSPDLSLLALPEGFLPYETAFDTPRAEPRARNKPKKKSTMQPTTTLVSALPETTYKEQNEPKGTERTIAYIQVQRSLLNWLAIHPADMLTPLQARRWTEAIEPRTLMPKVQDALRLCYYMRSQSFDTYAKINNGYISLYVVNQSSHTRDPKHDRLYWKQSCKTNYVEYMAPSNEGRASRRNAMVADTYTYNMFSMAGDMPMLTPTRIPAALHAAGNDLLNFLGIGPSLPALSPAITNMRQRLTTVRTAAVDEDAESLSVLREATERNLNRLLIEEAQDSNAIQAALAQIEEIDQQLQ